MRQLPPCDVITLHWVAGFVDYQAFFSALPQGTTVVWRLADMNVITGGCHYDDGCGKFLDGCGQCPQLGSSDPLDLSKRIWERKRLTFHSLNPSRLHVIANNNWIADQSRKSPLLGRFPVTVIPNMIDTDVFAPRDQYFARDVLRVPKDARILLFAADSATNKRKGFAFLAEALEGLSEVRNIFLLSVGGGKPILNSRIQHMHLGHISNDRFLSLIYSAADVFVIPSLQESFGNTVLEAMACGTPVLATPRGAVPEVVIDGRTGFIAADLNELADAVSRLGEIDRVACRDHVEREFSPTRFAQRWERLIHSYMPTRSHGQRRHLEQITGPESTRGTNLRRPFIGSSVVASWSANEPTA